MDESCDIESMGGNRRFFNDLALALDGELFEEADEVEDAYQAALLVDRVLVTPSIKRLRSLGTNAVAVAAHRYDNLVRLLQVLDVPYRLLAGGEPLGGASIVVLGCGVAEEAARVLVGEARDSGTIVVSSDRTACLAPLARLLHPRSPSSPRTARARWHRGGESNVGGDDGESSRHYPVALSPGHVPVVPSATETCILLEDGFTGEPLVMMIRDGELCVLHAVPHWWQTAAIVDTAVDRRLIRAIPAYEGIGLQFPELVYGPFSAARVMLSAFLFGLEMAMSRRTDARKN